MVYCVGCGKPFITDTRYHLHLMSYPFCRKAVADEEAKDERKNQAREAAESAAEAAAEAAIAAAVQENPAQEAERHDTNVPLDSNDSSPIEDEDEVVFPFADDDCDGDEDNNKETADNKDGDDDGEEEEDEDEDEDEDDVSDESDDSADQKDDDPVRVGVRVSFPFDVPTDATDQSKTEERYFHGTITSKKGDRWVVRFDDGDKAEHSFQDTLEAVGVYKELDSDNSDSENDGDAPTHGGEDAQEEEESPTDGILDDVCKLIDAVTEDSDIRGNPKGIMTPQNQAAAELIALLQDCKAPISLYSAIANWHNDIIENGKYKAGRIPTREKLLKNLAKRYHMKGLYPKEKVLCLPNAGSKIKVNTFSFTETLTSLLTDPELMKDENFAFPDPNDPFSAPEKWTDDKKSPEYQQQKKPQRRRPSGWPVVRKDLPCTL